MNWKATEYKRLTKNAMKNKRGKFARKLVRQAVRKKIWLERDSKNDR